MRNLELHGPLGQGTVREDIPTVVGIPFWAPTVKNAFSFHPGPQPPTTR